MCYDYDYGLNNRTRTYYLNIYLHSIPCFLMIVNSCGVVQIVVDIGSCIVAVVM